MKNFSTKKLAALALLCALEIVLSRFLSFNAWNMKIGFAFLPVALAGIFYGPLPAGIVAAVSDLLGALLFPIGAYFPGFTFTAFLTGLVFGVFLKKHQGILHIAAAVGINQLILSLFLNSFWISVLYGSPYKPLLATRLLQCAILLPVEITVLYFIRKFLPQLKKAAGAE